MSGSSGNHTQNVKNHLGIYNQRHSNENIESIVKIYSETKYPSKNEKSSPSSNPMKSFYQNPGNESKKKYAILLVIFMFFIVIIFGRSIHIYFFNIFMNRIISFS